MQTTSSSFLLDYAIVLGGSRLSYPEGQVLPLASRDALLALSWYCCSATRAFHYRDAPFPKILASSCNLHRMKLLASSLSASLSSSKFGSVCSRTPHLGLAIWTPCGRGWSGRWAAWERRIWTRPGRRKVSDFVSFFPLSPGWKLLFGSVKVFHCLEDQRSIPQGHKSFAYVFRTLPWLCPFWKLLVGSLSLHRGDMLLPRGPLANLERACIFGSLHTMPRLCFW